MKRWREGGTPFANRREQIGPQGTVYDQGRFQAYEQTWELLVVQAGMGNERAAMHGRA